MFKASINLLSFYVPPDFTTYLVNPRKLTRFQPVNQLTSLGSFFSTSLAKCVFTLQILNLVLLICLILWVISDSKLHDAGLYTCLIKTSYGQASSSASINILAAGAGDNLTAVSDMLVFPASPSKPKLINSGRD